MDNIQEKFGEIYDQYIGKIYRFVFLKVNSQEVAEDITSKVFVKGWESYQIQELQAAKNEEEGVKNPGAFLYQIARNAVIDHYREKGRTNIVSSETSPEIVDPGVDIHEQAIINADFASVKSAMQNIKKDYQDIIIWHYIDDIPIEQIAQVMEKPAGTVRVMMHRGLKALKDEMESAKKKTKVLIS